MFTRVHVRVTSRGPHFQTSQSPACLISYTPRESLHLGTFTPPCISTTLFGVVTRSRLRLVTLQVSKADGWHGARRMARADTQQTQQKQKQKQQKQQKQKQPTDGSQTRVPSFTSDPAGAVGVEARLVCPQLRTQPPDPCSRSRNLLAIFLAHASYLLCVGRTCGRVS